MNNHRTETASPVELHTGNMTSSSSPYPSLSPSPQSSPEETATAAALPGAANPVEVVDRSGPLLPSKLERPPPSPSPLTDGHGASNAIPSPDAAAFASTTDGLTERLFRPKTKGPIAAIFIHAGAGFHSTVNEHVHLEACSE